jgi:SAM-dependent methyltransferase
LARLAGTGRGCRVLEIGCGTGQATLPLAEQGCEIVAVELGAELAAVARRKLERFPVDVQNSTFEDWPLPAEPFDLVIAATSFHWVDPLVRVTKSADALRPGGALATIVTEHVAGGSEEFFAQAQDCYLRFDPQTTEFHHLRETADIPEDGSEIERSGRFGPVTFRRHEYEETYSTQQYLDVLRTYSGHRLLTPDDRAGLLGCLGHLIDTRHGGHITKRYLFELQVAYREA